MARRARSSAAARTAASTRPRGEVYRQERPEERLARQRRLEGLREALKARQREAEARLRPALESVRAGVVAPPTHAEVLARAAFGPARSARSRRRPGCFWVAGVRSK